MGRPHIVILGAGASLACCPNGDANGNPLPTMLNFVEKVGLEEILSKNDIEFKGKNFEEIFSDLHADKKNQKLITEIENIVFEYLEKLELPIEPTLYDHLVLSLRKKDLIATFNWDPLLYLALWRNYKEIKNIPHSVYLHGNTAIAYCQKHKVKGWKNGFCQKCRKSFEKISKILFPIKEKGYEKDPFISAEWKTLENYLKNAYILTIFGYGAPTSDTKAIEIMKKAWGDPQKREFEQIEIIDIRSEEDLEKTWNPFIHSHHYTVQNNFYESFLAKFPRRSCESFWGMSMECKFIDETPLPKDVPFPELWDWCKQYTDVENYNS